MLYRSVNELTVLDEKLISVLDVGRQVPSEHGIKCLGDLRHHWSDEVGCCSCTDAGLVVDELSLLVIFLETGEELDNIGVL